MRFIYSILLGFALLTLACHKDTPSTDPIINPPPPSPTQTEYIPIYNACDTSVGKAYALKSTKRWLAGALCRSYKSNGEDSWLVELTTCSSEGYIREFMGFGPIPDNNPVKKYMVRKVSSSTVKGAVNSSYSTLSQDGDVLEDYYYPDTTDVENFVEIVRWDTLNKQAEGRFHISFNIKEPRWNPINPHKVTFSSGRFWLKLP